ncbi:hypothetical protein D3C85_953110 [compost metagenome]
MESSLKKSKEVAHFANDLNQKISSLAYEMNIQNSEHQNIIEDTSEIIKNLSLKLNENDQDELSRLIKYISLLVDSGSSNFTAVLDLFEWSTDKTEKYVSEYKSLAKSLGYEID